MTEPNMKRIKLNGNKKKFFGNRPGAGHRKQFLEVGLSGFLITCNFQERDCIKDSYNILNEYADALYGPQAVPPKDEQELASAEDNEADIADTLNKEVSQAVAPAGSNAGSQRKRFQAVETGATNCVFIRTGAGIKPTELAARIIKDLVTTGQRKTRFVLRLLPIELVCRANMDDIKAMADKLFDQHFTADEPNTFCIVFNRRFNNDIRREETVVALAALIHAKNNNNSVDLRNPQKTVLVEILKGFCLMAVIEGYVQNKKYNLAELGGANTDADANTNVEANADAKADVKANTDAEANTHADANIETNANTDVGADANSDVEADGGGGIPTA